MRRNPRRLLNRAQRRRAQRRDRRWARHQRLHPTPLTRAALILRLLGRALRAGR